MLSRFFIHRPIFASVISILIVIAGAVSIFQLPISQYPDISPPMIQVTATYPGADPQVVSDTVASPIEQQVNGVENMLYMYSTSASDGSYTLWVTFELGTNIDMATVLVQNRVSIAMPQLPEDVQRLGVTTKKSSTTFVNVLGLYSPKGTYNDLFLTNYVTINIKDQIARLKGVGDVQVFPLKDYGMRIWLNPEKLEYNSLTTNDVVNALKQQNVQVAAGQIGQQPAPPGQDFQLTIKTLGRLDDVSQFENIIVKTGETAQSGQTGQPGQPGQGRQMGQAGQSGQGSQGGRIVRIKDVARVELGGKMYDTLSFMNGVPSATIIVYQAPGSNALQVADEVRKKMDELKKDFPSDVDYKIVYDISDFVRTSIHEVVKTLFEAFILVFLVVFIFLQDWRATLIPAVTIPVSLIGTFAVMALMGFSINMVTLFGMVLAIGIVVDDAIVVVENVERNMTQFGLSAKDAALRAMDEITGAIVGITLVLMAVFVPAAFLGGITGQLYRQFSLTIAFTTLFSAINALTLSPALCALLLRPHHGEKNIFFRTFNNAFERLGNGYTNLVTHGLRKLAVMLIVFAVAVALTYVGFIKIPTGFLPDEDDGLIMINAQLPDGASLERTVNVLNQVGEILKTTKGMGDFTVLPGYSIIDNTGANLGGGFASLKPWDERLEEGRSKEVIMRELLLRFSKIQEAIVFPFSLPPIMGVGQSGGFEMMVQDKGAVGVNVLAQAGAELAAAANAEGEVQGVNSTFRASVPTLFADVDRVKALNMKVPLQSVFDTMQAYLGSTYVNDFNKFGRTWQVKVQADSKYRTRPDDITRLQVRSLENKMVPLGTLVKVEETVGPQRINRYNMFPSARVAGEPAPGISSGQSIQVMETLAREKLPPGMGYEWTGMAFQEKQAGGQIFIVFGLAVLVVLLLLSAQYESWIDPLAVILVVPLAVLGAALGLLIRHFDNNLYTQVGLVLLVGLSAKNAILIVEFARAGVAEGKSAFDAAVEGARLRFRPILMTSFAFIIGVLPLVVASGAGAASRQSLGTAVFAGMLGVTCLGVIFTPALYVAMQKVRTILGNTLKRTPQTPKAEL
ncbi:MAG: efflux RND transporter permease subunit [Thermodesulfobacteriota bacterium]